MTLLWYAMIGFLWALGLASVSLGCLLLVIGLHAGARSDGDQIVAIYGTLIGLALILVPLMHFFA